MPKDIPVLGVDFSGAKADKNTWVTQGVFNDDTLILVEKSLEEMSVVHHGVTVAPGKRARLLYGFVGFDGETFWSDHWFSF